MDWELLGTVKFWAHGLKRLIIFICRIRFGEDGSQPYPFSVKVDKPLTLSDIFRINRLANVLFKFSLNVCLWRVTTLSEISLKALLSIWPRVWMLVHTVIPWDFRLWPSGGIPCRGFPMMHTPMVLLDSSPLLILQLSSVLPWRSWLSKANISVANDIFQYHAIQKLSARCHRSSYMDRQA